MTLVSRMSDALVGKHELILVGEDLGEYLKQQENAECVCVVCFSWVGMFRLKAGFFLVTVTETEGYLKEEGR